MLLYQLCAFDVLKDLHFIKYMYAYMSSMQEAPHMSVL